MGKRNHPNAQQGSGQSKAAKRRAKLKAKAGKSENMSYAIDGEGKESSSSSKKGKMTLWDSEEEEDEVVIEKKREEEVVEESEEEEKVVDVGAGEEEEEEEDEGVSGDDYEDDDISLTPSEEEKMLANSDFTSQARSVFSTILHPIPPLTFYSTHYEKRPLHISRNLSSPPLSFLSKKDIESYISKYSLKYGEDLNVTNVVDGVRRTLDIPGTVAKSEDVWSNFSSGCSIRLLCPQNYSEEIWETLSCLEHEFGCMIGSNAYLTPKSSQGFAPHYDNVDVFILQMEGKKRWRVYKPGENGFRKEEVLPRVSSKDYDPDKMPKPYLDVTLGPGDLLYLPRGWIHQAVTTDRDDWSLHLTVSCMMEWSWCDYIESVLPEATGRCFGGEETSFREGMPRGFLEYMGVANDNDYLLKAKNEGAELKEADAKVINKRTQFRKILKGKMDKLTKEVLRLADYGADEMGKVFMSDRLPPMLSESEKNFTSDNRGGNGEICAETLVRLTRPGIARLCLEEGKAILYHCGDNSRTYRGQALSPMEFETDDAPTIELILKTVAPFWVKVDDLPHPPSEDLDDKIGVVESLYEEGIVSIEQPGFIRDRVGKK
ncbi:hypothetical protein TrLO_g332 [Triparma laevis f. longispina]|uniref:Bifunctional lysine-specific demethylase and histidyl-hydroxylase n=1 Tax=Triparma laevis f. longispina TaxID=1714387 RepID=A0A9W7AYY2_9STRA|nr:hypothetical protein TrLO_g332 [Triparma laevis f. longispina]